MWLNGKRVLGQLCIQQLDQQPSWWYTLPAQCLVLSDQLVRLEKAAVRGQFEVQRAVGDLLQPACQRLHVRVDDQVSRAPCEQRAALRRTHKNRHRTKIFISAKGYSSYAYINTYSYGDVFVSLCNVRWWRFSKQVDNCPTTPNNEQKLQ